MLEEEIILILLKIIWVLILTDFKIFRDFNVEQIYMPAKKIFMNLGNSFQYRTNAIRTLNTVQINTATINRPSVRVGLMAPMINRVASATASCGGCGK